MSFADRPRLVPPCRRRSWKRLPAAVVLLGLLGAATAQAGGRRCACDESLNPLDPSQAPAELRLAAKSSEIVAAFDVGDRAIAALEFLGFAGDTLAVAVLGGPGERGESCR